MILRIRRHVHHGDICDVWLISELSGGARGCLMHGTTTLENAQLIAERFGTPVEWDEMPLPSSAAEPEMTPEFRLEKCRGLF